MSQTSVNSCLVLAATVAALVCVFHPRVVNSVRWQATVIPLASIIGSGFLILAPILKHDFGGWGFLVMLSLCVAAYGIGGAIRFNIARHESYRAQSAPLPTIVSRLESLASCVLALAYVISITYYLNLFGAFSVSLTSVDDQTHARIVTTAALAFVALFGWIRGFSALEHIEEGTVGLKLGVIVGLLVGLIAFSAEQLCRGDGLYFATTDRLDWNSIAVAMGLLVTVQGFETSRYLGDEYDAETRIRTMRDSQWISSAIYLVYIALTSFCFSDRQVGDHETAIVGMAQLVAPVLPTMLVVAALAAQFSAAVADTAGCGGLAEEVTWQRIKPKNTYLLIGICGVTLTWTADIYSIIALASRSFAAYYAIQCSIAVVFSALSNTRNRLRVASYIVLAFIAAIVVVVGRPAE